MQNSTGIIWICFSLLLLISCSSFHTTKNQKELLQNEIEKWNQFHIEGIIEINYKDFVFRKHFSAQKNSKTFRIDIIDSALFGFNPTPFISLYVDSLLYIKKFPEFELEKNTLPVSFSNLDLEKQFFDAYKHLKDNQIKLSDYSLHFNEFMAVKYFQTDTVKVYFDYNQANHLEKITVMLEEKTIAVFYIDKFTKEIQNIQPLK